MQREALIKREAGVGLDGSDHQSHNGVNTRPMIDSEFTKLAYDLGFSWGEVAKMRRLYFRNIMED